MSRIIRCGLTQTHHDVDGSEPLEKHKQSAIDKHLKLIEEAAAKDVKILCFQEIFNGPYFCAEQETKWYGMAEPVPDGPTVKLMQEQAKKHNMVLLVPVYEEAITGVYFNTTAVIDADGTYLGKYRKTHIPHVGTKDGYGFFEKFYFKPGVNNPKWPVFETAYAKIGIFICYDRHFPECARMLGLKGAEILFNPSATVAGTSEYLWKLEQPAQAVANGLFIGANNRLGFEAPWNMGEFYGQSYFVDPKGQIVAEGTRDEEGVIIGDLDLDMIKEIRNKWQFYRDRRPSEYTIDDVE
ncbi:MAG: nitrilase-related carbon-nitrogen hydrolase [Bacillota bacterium]|nr:nitrilase-related carbon-nitrogen hydrolase [Bacillota bacterium]MDW7677229.1 nitrilase-related carbon-nitrogen hydrolase [Bacillota bacterium]